MGRCYEFGVAVGNDCEHAMAVGPEGGYCGCRHCGARCEGRFRACVGILDRPGYVPLAAPKVAPPTAQAPATVTAPATNGEASVRRKGRFSLFGGAPDVEEAPNERVLGEFRSMLATLLDRHERALAAIDSVEATVGARDLELIAAFNRLTQAYTELTRQVQAGHEELADLAAAVVRLAERIDEREQPAALLRLEPYGE